ncbi:MAG: polyprenyl synthetase family protein [Brumimicrobium sp.]|nr:polyprenyl synthetase family protein [Brumimicrobium sp.]MCO5269582.1 polyprenyl synthetase family protein [Brumimicrobium sp.]
MPQLPHFQKAIEDSITNYPFPSTPRNLYEPLNYFLSLGGKRMRPALTLLACELFGKPAMEALNAGVAVELFHNFTLIHDDIMDEAPLRRGNMTVHEKWGRDVAILSGDVLYTEAFKLLLNYSPHITSKLLAILTKVSQEVCEGQQMDMDFEKRTDVSIEEYIEMIRLKTSVLLGAALEMGAVVAGVENEEDIRNCYEFGVNIGIAFQIQDDILDVYANPDKFGKQVGGDILSNKKTILLLSALQFGNKEYQERLQVCLYHLEGHEKIEEVKKVFDAIGVRELVEKQKTLFYHKALKNMQQIHVPETQKSELINLANFLMMREY